MEWVLLIGRIMYGGFFVIGGAMHFKNMALLGAALALYVFSSGWPLSL